MFNILAFFVVLEGLFQIYSIYLIRKIIDSSLSNILSPVIGSATTLTFALSLLFWAFLNLSIFCIFISIYFNYKLSGNSYSFFKYLSKIILPKILLMFAFSILILVQVKYLILVNLIPLNLFAFISLLLLIDYSKLSSFKNQDYLIGKKLLTASFILLSIIFNKKLSVVLSIVTLAYFCINQSSLIKKRHYLGLDISNNQIRTLAFSFLATLALTLLAILIFTDKIFGILNLINNYF